MQSYTCGGELCAYVYTRVCVCHSTYVGAVLLDLIEAGSVLLCLYCMLQALKEGSLECLHSYLSAAVLGWQSMPHAAFHTSSGESHSGHYALCGK